MQLQSMCIQLTHNMKYSNRIMKFPLLYKNHSLAQKQIFIHDKFPNRTNQNPKKFRKFHQIKLKHTYLSFLYNHVNLLIFSSSDSSIFSSTDLLLLNLLVLLPSFHPPCSFYLHITLDCYS